MKKLIEYLNDAKQNQWSLGHFNFASSEQLQGIVNVAKELNAPVLVGTSEGEGDFVGMDQAVALVKSWKEDGIPVFLASDHTKSFEKAKEAIDAGYEYILIDGSKMSLDENTEMTKKVVDYAKGVNPEILVEGEIGYLRGSSKVQETVEISKDDFTKPEEARSFVDTTGIDCVAVVIGNIHGITTEQEMTLDLDLLSEISQALPDKFLVLHGASGLENEEVQETIKRGIVNVHYNTEIRVAMQEALKETLEENPEEISPYKYMGPKVEAVSGVVRDKINMLGSKDRA
jgi:fructose-bisphosphate aldolase class II